MWLCNDFVIVISGKKKKEKQAGLQYGRAQFGLVHVFRIVWAL